MNPLVSICIPTYNGALYLNEAFESIKKQTYKNIEVIVSDDDSKDETLVLVKKFKNEVRFPVFIYHHKPNNIGANWNNCIINANGNYIKFLFQDDVLLPNCIKKMVTLLQNDESIALVASQRTFLVADNYWSEDIEQWIHQFGNLQKQLNIKFEQGIGILDTSLFKSEQFLRSPLNKIGEPSVIMFRKEVVDIVGYYREDLKQILDYEFCYRVLKKYKIAILSDALVQFRLHQMQETNVNSDIDTGDSSKYHRLIYDEYLHYLNDYNRVHFLKKYNLFYRFLYRFKKKLGIN